jgi:membrane protein YqaA with SNARE-associated domain
MWYLSVASFLETTVIPVAIELVLVPFMLANRNRIWTIATVTLAGCLAGAILGYLVGLLFFDTAGIWLIDTFGQREAYEDFQDRFNRQGFWAIVAIGITPIPFPIAMLAAGAADYSFPLYLLACSIARGVRYYGLSALVALAGPRVLDWLQKGQRATKLTAAIAVAVVVGMLLFYF